MRSSPLPTAAPLLPLPPPEAPSSSPSQLGAHEDAGSAASAAWTSSPYSSLPSHLSTYVSEHYHIDREEVFAYLRRKQLLPFRLSAGPQSAHSA